MDFFLVQNFIGDGDEIETRLVDYMGDSRFWGVYFLLANLLCLDDAKELREKLIQYAAEFFCAFLLKSSTTINISIDNRNSHHFRLDLMI